MIRRKLTELREKREREQDRAEGIAMGMEVQDFLLFLLALHYL